MRKMLAGRLSFASLGFSPQWRNWPITPFTRTASSCDYEYDEEQGRRVKNQMFVQRSSTNAFVFDNITNHGVTAWLL
jgi:hypothetical protein